MTGVSDYQGAWEWLASTEYDVWIRDEMWLCGDHATNRLSENIVGRGRSPIEAVYDAFREDSGLK